MRNVLSIVNKHLNGQLFIDRVVSLHQHLKQIVVHSPVFVMPLEALPGDALSEFYVFDLRNAELEAFLEPA